MREIVLNVYNLSGIFHDEKTGKDISYKTASVVVGHFDDSNNCNYITLHKATSAVTEKAVGKSLKDCFYDRHGRIVSFR